MKGFQWEFPNYTVSIVLLSICAILTSCVGYLFAKQTRTHAIFLFLLFTATGLIQCFMNAGNERTEPTSVGVTLPQAKSAEEQLIGLVL